MNAASLAAQRWLGHLPLFDPRDGDTIAEPAGVGAGWWAGAPSVCRDAETGTWWLAYRMRKPRELGRGAECRIARSDDGVRFATVWTARKDDFATASMERGCLLKGLDGRWRYYLSYVDPADNRWRIDVMEADAPDRFDPAARRSVLAAADLARAGSPAEGVKDPWIVVLGRRYWMLASYAPAPSTVATVEAMHGTGDVYNTGITKSHTGLATSEDGIVWEWRGDILSPPDAGWDAYATRLGCVLWTPPVFTGFYDGSSSVAGNYEERTGIAVSTDLRTFVRATTGGPALVSPHGSGSLRYLDAVVADSELRAFYEYARPDGSHELRHSRMPWPFDG